MPIVQGDLYPGGNELAASSAVEELPLIGMSVEEHVKMTVVVNVGHAIVAMRDGVIGNAGPLRIVMRNDARRVICGAATTAPSNDDRHHDKRGNERPLRTNPALTGNTLQQRASLDHNTVHIPTPPPLQTAQSTRSLPTTQHAQTVFAFALRTRVWVGRPPPPNHHRQRIF